MSTTIDSLELQIQNNSTGAVKGIDSLISSLGQLKSATSGGAGLTVISNQITKLNDALGKVSPGSVSNLNGLANGLKSLSSIGNFKLSPAIATQITTIGNAARSLDGVNFAPVADLATALQPLSSIGKTNLGAAVNQLSRFPNIAAQLGAVNFSGFSAQIQTLVSALAPLSTIAKSNLGTALNQLGKIPTITAQLATVDMGAFAAQIQRVTAAVAPLAAQMQKVSNGFNAFPAKIQKLISSNTGLAASNTKAGKSFAFLGSGVMAAIAKLTLVAAVIKRVIRAIGDLFKESSDYIEAVNLFNVTMGSAARAAGTFALKVQELLGIDAKEWMQNQGVFQQMIKGFGVASDKATIMSRNLTQLGYDLSSLYNVDVQTAMDKLQSAMSGQIKGMREFGVETSVAALQEYALSQGIKKSVSDMSMAEKSLLRYNLIMERTINMHGDLGRTINSPANALRLLNAQWTQLKRQLGAIVSVIATAVIPVLRAVTKVITALAARIASLFGFDINDYFQSIDSASDVEFGYDEQLDSAADSAKKLKGLLAGFDQLNIIGQQDNSGSGGTGGGGGVGDMPLFDNDKWLEGIDTSAFDAMVEKLKAIGAEIARIWEPVTERITGLFATIKSQIDALDWGEAFSKAGWALVDAYRAIVETIIAVAAPIVEALNIPAIVYESVNLYTAALTALKDILDAIRPGFEAFVEKGIKPIAEWVGGKVAESLRKMQEWLGKIGEWFSEHEPMFTAFGDAIGELLGAIWSVLEPIFNIIGDTLWKKFGDDLGFIGGTMEIIVPLITLIADVLTPLVEIVAGLLNILIGIVTLDFSQVTAGADQIAEAFTTGFDDVGKSATALWESIKKVWNDVSSWFDRTVITPVKTAFNTAISNIKGFFTGLWSGIKSTFSSLANWFKTTVTEPIGNFFKGAVNVVIRALNSLILGLNKVKINLPSWGILGDLAGKSFGINIATIPTLANGGLIDSGQLFMARENGITEMIGSFGNKSGVANNSQIVDGIRQGVADASSEQNALLREQNRLLRALVEKEGKVVFPTSIEAGRAVQKSLNMYNVARGTT